MLEPGQEFTREDSVPKDVIDYFSKYEIGLEGWGVVAGEACTFLVLDPNVTILAHQWFPDSHPEATTHLWAAQIHLPGSKTYRILFYWNGSFLFLHVRLSWNDFPPAYNDLIRRALEVEDGSTPRPNVSVARMDFERFLAKHREVTRPRNLTRASSDVSIPENGERSEMRLIREYRRLATTCMQRLERLPS
jgi:hypothetical protein